MSCEWGGGQDWSCSGGQGQVSWPCFSLPPLCPTDTARSFLKRNKMGQYNEEEMSKKAAEQEQRLAEEKALAEAISVGDRCEVRSVGQPNKRGTVMYVGE